MDTLCLKLITCSPAKKRRSFLSPRNLLFHWNTGRPGGSKFSSFPHGIIHSPFVCPMARRMCEIELFYFTRTGSWVAYPIFSILHHGNGPFYGNREEKTHTHTKMGRKTIAIKRTPTLPEESPRTENVTSLDKTNSKQLEN